MKNDKLNALKESKAARKIASATASLSAVLLTAAPSFAATKSSEDILDRFQSLINNNYGKIQTAVVSAGFLMALIAVGVMLFATSDRTAESAKGWLKRIIIGVILVLSLGGIFNLITNLTSGLGFDPSSIKY